MCKQRAIDNCVQCIFTQGLLNINVVDFEIDDNNDIGLVDDPNADDIQMEIDIIPVDNNVEVEFEYQPFPEINYDMIDCELALDDIIEEIEVVLDNIDKH